MSDTEAAPVGVPETVKLSPSIAKILLESSPMHARDAHRLLGGASHTDTAATLDGRILESVIFGLNNITIAPFDNWKTEKARAFRAQVEATNKAHKAADPEANGFTCVLQDDWPLYADQGQAMHKSLVDAGCLFEGGAAQKTIVWTDENGCECKTVLDYIIVGDDYYLIYDLKCVDDASAEAMSKKIWEYGWHIQAAAEMEAVESRRPDLAGRGRYILAPVEKNRPFAANPRELSGRYLQIGQMQWQKAKGIWKRCLDTNTWPGYPTGYFEPTSWQNKLAEELEQEGA